MATINQYAGGFLIAEGLASIIFSECKNPLFQIGRIIRIGIGLYVYDQK